MCHFYLWNIKSLSDVHFQTAHPYFAKKCAITLKIIDTRHRMYCSNFIPNTLLQFVNHFRFYNKICNLRVAQQPKVTNI